MRERKNGIVTNYVKKKNERKEKKLIVTNNGIKRTRERKS